MEVVCLHSGSEQGEAVCLLVGSEQGGGRVSAPQGPRPFSLKRVEVFSFVLGLGVNSGLSWGHPGAWCFLHWGGAMHTCVCFLGDVRSGSILDSKGADIQGGLCDIVCSDGTGLPTLWPRARGAIGMGRGLCPPPAAQGLQCAL